MTNRNLSVDRTSPFAYIAAVLVLVCALTCAYTPAWAADEVASTGHANLATGVMTTASDQPAPAAKAKVKASDAVGEGWYSLRSAKGSSLYLDVAGASDVNGNLVEMWSRNSSPAQAFKLVRAGKYYRLMAGAGTKACIVMSADGSVKVHRGNSKASLYSLKRNKNGSYRLVNAVTGLALATGASPDNGTLVKGVKSKANRTAQSFFLEKRHGILLEDVYLISSKLSGNRSLSVRNASTAQGAVAELEDYAATFSQKWGLIPVTGHPNVYRIESIATGKRLTASASGTVAQSKATSSNNQCWELARSKGSFTLLNLGTGKALDVSSLSCAVGSAAKVATPTSGARQRWYINEVPAVQSGLYQLRLAEKSSLALDVAYGSVNEGANIGLWKANGDANQRWYYDEEAGTFTSIASGKALDVATGSTASGTNIVQWSLNGSANQRWKITYARGGNFRITPAIGDGLALSADVATQGANVTSSSYAGAANQKWKFRALQPRLSSSIRSALSNVNQAGVRAYGMDVSQWQGVINWGAVKAAGIDFAIIRAGHGTSITDSQFVANVRGCQANGIRFGVYYYSTAHNVAGAKAEAKHALKVMKAAGVSGSDMDFCVYYDLEESNMASTSNRKLLADMASAFSAALSANGYTMGVYANLNWWNNFLTDPAFGRWDRWVAQWRVSRCAYNGSYRFWQFTSTGRVPGIETDVDLDLMY